MKRKTSSTICNQTIKHARVSADITQYTIFNILCYYAQDATSMKQIIIHLGKLCSNIGELSLRWFARHGSISPCSLAFKKLQQYKVIGFVYDWDPTSAPIYNLDGVATLTNLRTLCISNATLLMDITPLSQLECLQDLSLLGCRHVVDFEPLKYLGRVTTLNLSNCNKLTSIGFVSGMPYLRSLDVSMTWVFDIGPVSCLRNLTTFDISLTEVTCIRPLLSNTSLTTLDISSTGVTCLTHVEENKLTSLSLVYSKIQQWDNLRNFLTLTSLDLGCCFGFANGYAVACLHNLKSLKLGFTEIDDVCMLAKLDKLELLKLTNCYKLTSVVVLQNFNKLTNLDLSGCDRINSIEPIGHLDKLESLDLSHMTICDIKNLTRCTSLKHLNLMNSTFLSLEPLVNLLSLRTIDVRGCNLKVCEVQALKTRENLSLDMRRSYFDRRMRFCK